MARRYKKWPKMFSRWPKLFLLLLGIVVLVDGGLHLVMMVMPLEPELVAAKRDSWSSNGAEPWGDWHRSYAKATHDIECVSAKYSANRFGMRDKGRRKKPGRGMTRVAVLGGSLTEGHLVDDTDTYTRILEEQVLDGKTEVLNFGTSEPFGTTQAWQLYKHMARNFFPRVLVLAFSHESDLHDNMWPYWKNEKPLKSRPYLVSNEAGGFDLFQPENESQRVQHTVWEKLKGSLLRYSAIAQSIRALIAPPHTEPTRPFPTRAVYSRTPHADIEAAWSVTEEALKRLAQEAKLNGVAFVLMHLPDPVQIDPARVQQLKDSGDYDPRVPNERMEAIVHRLGIRYFSLLDEFQLYRDQQKLNTPYFSHPCDPHWSPLGHRVAAEALGSFLIQNRLLRR